MNKTIEIEITNLIAKYNLNCNIKDFKYKSCFFNDIRVYFEEKFSIDFLFEFINEFDYLKLFTYQLVPENFIEEAIRLSKIKDGDTFAIFGAICYNQILSEEFMRRHISKINWAAVSQYQKISEGFIREFQDKVDWYYISKNQNLSEGFIREFQDKMHWVNVSIYQRLSESFIREFKNKVNWVSISLYQRLSGAFIKEFNQLVDWDYISESQTLSNDVLEEFQDKINLTVYRRVHEEMSREYKLKEIKKYAKRYNLRFDGDFIYLYYRYDKYKQILNRILLVDNLDSFVLLNEKNKYYRAWRCDMREYIPNSFGLEVRWDVVESDILIKVSVDDWGCEIKDTGIVRIWGFTVV